MKDTTAPPRRTCLARCARPVAATLGVAACAILLNRVLTQSGPGLLLTAGALVVTIALAILALPLLDRIPSRPRSTRRVDTAPSVELRLVTRR